MKPIIEEIFVPNYFPNGYNLFVVIWEQKPGLFYVQTGHDTYKYKRLTNATKRYYSYLKQVNYRDYIIKLENESK